MSVWDMKEGSKWVRDEEMSDWVREVVGSKWVRDGEGSEWVREAVGSKWVRDDDGSKWVSEWGMMTGVGEWVSERWWWA